MNIFILDTDIKRCAQYHNDRHCVKMITEYNQMLSTAYRYITGEDSDILYKSTHANHPCCDWVKDSHKNFEYLLLLNYYLAEEYTHRYNKRHAGMKLIEFFLNNTPKYGADTMTQFAQAMPDQYTTDEMLPVNAYRNYYINEKRHIAHWKNRSIPDWWQ